ncbi:glycosyltransferase family 20 protein [Jaapia argillacea MUCL 33604]|uniref:Glycosyltransferase family 20 protein n=1 Tax=Jaapia argillacea MUCL 33604 TaxID=933084 RepID=A0A067PUB4_9AGAM|nr:glycosyltransferase family 20 protein [Jaapia argillacea MUCL 33604]
MEDNDSMMMRILEEPLTTISTANFLRLDKQTEIRSNERYLSGYKLQPTNSQFFSSSFSPSPHPLPPSPSFIGLGMDSFTEPTRLGDTDSLEDVRAAVQKVEAEIAGKGIKLTGRVIHLCHYLPIVASLSQPSNAAPSLNKNNEVNTSDDPNVPSTSIIPPTPLSPPATPPAKPVDTPSAQPANLRLSDALGATATKEEESPVDGGKQWSLGVRHGHAAMISGIRSLSATHEQLIIGWPGDIYSSAPFPSASTPTATSPTPSSSFSSPYSQATGTDTKIPLNKLGEGEKKKLEEAIEGYKVKEDDPDDEKPLSLVPVWLEDGVAHGHYDGYCKTTLWPLFHYLLWQDVATEYASADKFWVDYETTNRMFAEKLKEVWREGDLVWVHDYHLLLVPRMIRAMIPEAYVGLFVHTPFPSSEVFRCLPRRKEILDGMLGANLVCFQTYSYSRHFTSSCVRVCGYETTSNGIDNQGHVTAIKHCPVGVDAERVARDTTRPGIQPKLEALRALYQDKKIIVGRDKLDVVKGVVQKLRAFEKLLHDYPEWIGNVVLIQVTSPALTDSPKLERQVSEIVSQINGEYGSLDFIPVHHYHQTIKKDEFYALLSVADLGVITPLRDGMNTTSMEFVIAQDKTKKSPLVLSEFMGISNNMSEALLVNPWNLGDVAAAMNSALVMPVEERERRHNTLHQIVTTHTSHTWAAILVKMLLSQVDTHGMAKSTPFLSRDGLEEKYLNAKKRLFLFDYDGTLAPIVKTPSMAIPSEQTLEALGHLTGDPKNLVYIISGRDQEFLEMHLGHFKNLGMSAEHGGFIREAGEEGWTNFTEKLDMDWMGEVLEIFKYYTERTTGSHIETKKSSITWHYRASDPEWGQFQCRQCQDLLENNLVHKRPIEVLVGKKNLEVRPIAVNKGEIVKRILYQNPDAEFVFCAGDDKTDEDMFRALLFTSGTGKLVMEPPLAVTLAAEGATPKPGPVDLAITRETIFTTAVGHSTKKTLAKWHVTSPQEVVENMLHLVERGKDVKSNL